MSGNKVQVDGVTLRGSDRAGWVAARLKGPGALVHYADAMRAKWREGEASRVISQNYRYLPAGPNARGQSVTFCYTIRKNTAGYFVTWQRTTRLSGSHAITRVTSYKSKGAARRTAERRLAAKAKANAARPPRAPRPVKQEPDPLTLTVQREQAKLKRWCTRAKRAATAIKKIERKIKRLTKRQGEQNG